MEIIGGEELIRQLRRLTDATAGKALRAAVRAAGTPVRNEAKRIVRKKSGRLQRAIGTRTKVINRYIAEVWIGFDRRTAFYGGQVELGHRLVRGKSKLTKRVVGHVPAYPFLRPALDTKAGEAEARLRESLSKNIQKLVKNGIR